MEVDQDYPAHSSVSVVPHLVITPGIHTHPAGHTPVTVLTTHVRQTNSTATLAMAVKT